MSNKHTFYFSDIWIGGKNLGNLFLSAQMSNQTSKDFQPGPVAMNYSDQNYLKKYYRVWKINKAQIDYHIANYSSSSYIVPEVILKWPGNGNIQNGEALKIAPFADLNSNSIYDPLLGEYPVIRGDQAIFLIFNDDKIHDVSNGSPMKIEIQTMLYAYDMPNDSVLNNTIFLSYAVINRSLKEFNDVYFGMFSDIDIGYPWDDYIGCDSLLNCFYGYNGYPVDGNNQIDHYGNFPPAQGVVFLNQTLRSFIRPVFNWSVPVVPENYYNFLSGLNQNGDSIFYLGSPTTFEYSGDPVTNEGWTETSSGNEPFDRRGLGSVGPFVFQPGKSICIDLAFPFARDFNNIADFSSVLVLKQRIPEIQTFYNSQNFDCISLSSISDTELSENPLVSVYPNPSSDIFNFVFNNKIDDLSLSIYTLQGVCLFKSKVNSELTQVDLGAVSNGFYFYMIYDESSSLKRGLILKQK
jgi:hypothetical protein